VGAAGGDAIGDASPMTAVTFVQVLVSVVVVLVVLTILYWVVMALLIKRGRRRRAERLAADPTAYPASDPTQDWHGSQS
jgi:flagellar biosynthesis/type III secretory pathway M-ring protein FliF/YscJ